MKFKIVTQDNLEEGLADVVSRLVEHGTVIQTTEVADELRKGVRAAMSQRGALVRTKVTAGVFFAEVLGSQAA